MDETHLSQLKTRWSLVFQACRGPGDGKNARQAELLERYLAAVYRYTLRVLGDAELAEEVCQEFALRFVRGDFRHADPSRGRFRDYVKTAVIHLLNEFRRKRRRWASALPAAGGIAEEAEAAAVAGQLERDEAEFLRAWRMELLNRTWHEMEQRQATSGPPYYAALRTKAQEPDLTAADLAARLEAAGFGPSTSAGVRQILHRAREVFSELLLEEVARSMMSNDDATLAAELADLDLLTYCRAALARRRA